MRLKRSQAYAIRNAIAEAEKQIPRNDRSQLAEYERDLSAQACVSLWDVDIVHMLRCLRRLSESAQDRREAWSKVYGLAVDIWKPVAQAA